MSRSGFAISAVQCDGKKRYPSWDAAVRAHRSLKRGMGPTEPYRCPHCHWWHVGHALPREPRPRLPTVMEDGFED